MLALVLVLVLVLVLGLALVLRASEKIEKVRVISR